MPQFRDIPVPPDAGHVRLQLSQADLAALRALGARGGGLTLSAVCRLAMSLLARGVAVTQEEVLAEAERVRARARGPEPAQPEPKRRGRSRRGETP